MLLLTLAGLNRRGALCPHLLGLLRRGLPALAARGAAAGARRKTHTPGVARVPFAMDTRFQWARDGPQREARSAHLAMPARAVGSPSQSMLAVLCCVVLCTWTCVVKTNRDTPPRSLPGLPRVSLHRPALPLPLARPAAHPQVSRFLPNISILQSPCWRMLPTFKGHHTKTLKKLQETVCKKTSQNRSYR